MNRIISLFIVFLIFFISMFNAFSFSIDGIDNGVEWDGASVYKLIDGESNCGINFGIVKVKFDREGNALCLCFQFLDPELMPDNEMVGVSVTVNDSVSYEIVSYDGRLYNDSDLYCFDGAIYIDENNGATCEIRIGFKSGLPESINCKVRFIDSHGYYSDYKFFTVINEFYEETENLVINPTADNNDPAYNPNYAEETERITLVKTTKETTTKKTTTKKSETYPLYIYSGYTEASTNKTKKNLTTKNSVVPKTSDTIKEKIYYYEKEVFISEVYIIPSTVNFVDETYFTSDINTTDPTIIESPSETSNQATSVSLTKGIKYKKIVAGIALTVFIAIACYGTYSAKKNKSLSE